VGQPHFDETNDLSDLIDRLRRHVSTMLQASMDLQFARLQFSRISDAADAATPAVLPDMPQGADIEQVFAQLDRLEKIANLNSDDPRVVGQVDQVKREAHALVMLLDAHWKGSKK
jgi:hypothetical protein